MKKGSPESLCRAKRGGDRPGPRGDSLREEAPKHFNFKNWKNFKTSRTVVCPYAVGKSAKSIAFLKKALFYLTHYIQKFAISVCYFYKTCYQWDIIHSFPTSLSKLLCIIESSHFSKIQFHIDNKYKPIKTSTEQLHMPVVLMLDSAGIQAYLNNVYVTHLWDILCKKWWLCGNVFFHHCKH